MPERRDERRASFENEFMGQQPTGQKGEPVYGIGIDRFEDGKVAESWSQWDTLRFMRNIGAMPEPASLELGRGLVGPVKASEGVRGRPIDGRPPRPALDSDPQRRSRRS
jgi:hypothetical protein